MIEVRDLSDEMARTHGPVLLEEYIVFTANETGVSFDVMPPSMRAEIDDVPAFYRSPGAFFVAFDGGVAVGAVGLADLGDGRLNVRRLYVRPAHQGSGVGVTLMKQCFVHARANKAAELVLDVIPTRTKALAWYRRLGFVDTEPFEAAPVPLVFLRCDLG